MRVCNKCGGSVDVWVGDICPICGAVGTIEEWFKCPNCKTTGPTEKLIEDYCPKCDHKIWFNSKAELFLVGERSGMYNEWEELVRNMCEAGQYTKVQRILNRLMEVGLPYHAELLLRAHNKLYIK